MKQLSDQKNLKLETIDVIDVIPNKSLKKHIFKFKVLLKTKTMNQFEIIRRAFGK